PGAAAGDDPAAAAGAPVAVPVRVLGAGDLRRPDDRALAPSHVPPAGGPGRAVPGAARLRAGAGPEDPRPLDAGAHPRHGAGALVRPAADPPAAPLGRGADRALDLRAPGGRRVVGRDP